MDSINDGLQLIAQPVDDQLDGGRYVLWTTTFDSDGLPLSEAITHKYLSVTELREFIVTICTPEDLLFFNFESLFDQLSQGQRYYAEIPRSLAENLGFIVSAKAAIGKVRSDSRRGNAAVAS